MSWFSILISNPFKSDSDNEENISSSSDEDHHHHHNQLGNPSDGGGVIKENLTEIRKNLSRQLWGVASFLAPPPVVAAATTSDSNSNTDSSSSHIFDGIRNDFAEISGSFKSSLSLLSSTKPVNEISRLATNLLQFPKEDIDTDELYDDIAGITDEILEFVSVMSTRPECWTDFPLSLHNNDFHMSDAQIQHSSTIEQLLPSLEALRFELCPSHIDEGRFWMIYFILLHPRLNYQDSLLLSTPQIVETRDVLLQNLRQRSTVLQSSSSNVNDIKESGKVSCDTGLSSNIDLSSKGSIGENIIVEQKEVLAETVHTVSQGNTDKQENADQWLEEEEADTEMRISSGSRKQQLGNEEDVSFSDLEDDDDESSRPARSTPGKNSKYSPHDGSSGWVQLSENSDNGDRTKRNVIPNSREKDSSGEESNDWLTVDDFDEDSVGTA